jgi:hypothetical protein
LQHDSVDAHAKNKAGSSALDIARWLELVDIARSLEEHAKGKVS